MYLSRVQLAQNGYIGSMMDKGITKLLLMVVWWTFLVRNTKCMKHNLKSRFNDVAESITYMYNQLSSDMPLEEKCKRYAILSSKALIERLPYQRTALYVATMDESRLNQSYKDMNISQISSALIAAVDRYRITKLERPFIDIIECLKQLNMSSVQEYLKDDELVIILDLYKQVLGLPSSMIDIKSLDLGQFHPAFASTLKVLFRGRLDSDTILSHIPLNPFVPRSSREQERSHASGSRSGKLRQGEQEARDLYLFQRRERSRLTQKRMRMINPDTINERNKKYYHQVLKSRRKHEQNLLAASAVEPDETLARQQAHEKRLRQNKLQTERRRKRREEIRLKVESLQHQSAPRRHKSAAAESQRTEKITKAGTRKRQHHRVTRRDQQITEQPSLHEALQQQQDCRRSAQPGPSDHLRMRQSQLIDLNEPPPSDNPLSPFSDTIDRPFGDNLKHVHTDLTLGIPEHRDGQIDQTTNSQNQPYETFDDLAGQGSIDTDTKSRGKTH